MSLAVESPQSISPEGVFRSAHVDYLIRFPRGESGTVVDMNTEPELQGRLMGMGLFTGTRFKLLQGGNSSRKPLLLAVGETRIVIGPEIAETILVEK